MFPTFQQSSEQIAPASLRYCDTSKVPWSHPICPIRNTWRMRTRNTIFHKLCSTSQGSTAEILSTSAFGQTTQLLITAHRCVSIHKQKVDVLLNIIRLTPNEFLPILNDMLPPDLSRKAALLRAYPGLPIFNLYTIQKTNHKNSSLYCRLLIA